MTEVIVNAETDDATVSEAATEEGHSEAAAEEAEAVEEVKDELDEVVDEVEDSQDDVVEAVDTVEEKLDDIEENLEQAGDNIDRLATAVVGLTQVVTDFRDYMETLTVEERTESTPVVVPAATVEPKTEGTTDNGGQRKRPVRRGYRGPIGRR